MTSVAVGGVMAEVEGEGFPVIMLHGLGGTSNLFQPQMETLRSWRVIRIDLPGSGRSPVPQENPTFVGFAEQVTGVAKLFGVTRAHFVGPSMGTIVCQMITATAPDLVRSLTLIGGLAEPTDATRKGLAARAQLARTEGMAPIAEQIVAGAISAATRANQPITVAFVRESIMRQNPEGYARTCEALAAAEAVDPRLISAPTLLLTGSDDAVNPPSVAEALRAKIPGASLSLIAGAGHWLPVEKPAECNQRIADFLKRVEQ
jgi:pimeloyl-ACP methyl ester carboxylesterase